MSLVRHRIDGLERCGANYNRQGRVRHRIDGLETAAKPFCNSV